MVPSAVLLRPPEATPGDQLVDSMHGAMRSVLRRLHPALEAEGITMGQFWALHLISSLGSASVSVVARHLSVSAPTICGKVDQMEAAGLIARHRSERDRRAVELSLTAKGRRTEARIWARLGRMIGEAAEELRPADVATAVRVFRELNARLDSRDASEGVVA